MSFENLINIWKQAAEDFRRCWHYVSPHPAVVAPPANNHF